MKHITFFTPSFGMGGVEHFLVAYANEFQRKGYQVDCVVCKSGGIWEQYLSEDVRLVDLGCVRLRKAFFPLRNYMKKENLDVFICCIDFSNFMTVLAALSLWKKPKILLSQQKFVDVESQMLGFWGKRTKLLMKIFYPHADKIFAVSRGTYDFLHQDVKLPAKKLTVIPNPVELSDLRNQANEKPNIELPANYIAFIGRFSPVKNIPLLLRAFDQVNIPDLELVLVGGGTEYDATKLMAASCKKAAMIHFTGESDNPYPVLKNAKILVSSSYSESFGIVLVEAMAFGKTVVATPTKGAIENLGDKYNKYISKDFEDENAFARLIEEAVRSPYPEEELLQEAEKYDLEQVLPLLEKLILEVSE
jgi:glycosyltransferase involved in cell wall biosynthesis